jgi:hypothetical protein
VLVRRLVAVPGKLLLVSRPLVVYGANDACCLVGQRNRDRESVGVYWLDRCAGLT